MKTCTKCGEVKALDAFYNRKRSSDGLMGYCKQCTALVASVYRKATPGKFKARKTAYRNANQEKAKAWNSKYRKANREKLKDKAAKLVAEMGKSYISTLTGIPAAFLTPEVLAIKREQLETHRLAKQLRQATKDEHASI